MDLFGAYIEGQFFNLFFPGFLAGDVARVTRTSKHGVFSADAVVAVLLERFSGLIMLCLFIGLVALLGGYDALGTVWRNSVLLAAVLLLALSAAMTTRTSAHLVNRFLARFQVQRVALLVGRVQHATMLLTASPRLLWRLGTLSLLFVLLSGPTAYFVARAIDVPISLEVLIIYAPLIAFLSNLPISISGVGVREHLSILFYGVLGLQPEEIIAFALAQSSILFVVKLSGGVVLILRYWRPSRGAWISPRG